MTDENEHEPKWDILVDTRGFTFAWIYGEKTLRDKIADIAGVASAELSKDNKYIYVMLNPGAKENGIYDSIQAFQDWCPMPNL